jgi:hypothetical protein
MIYQHKTVYIQPVAPDYTSSKTLRVFLRKPSQDAAPAFVICRVYSKPYNSTNPHTTLVHMPQGILTLRESKALAIALSNVMDITQNFEDFFTERILETRPEVKVA